MSLEEAELYIQDVLNQLPDETINKICKKACEWKTVKMMNKHNLLRNESLTPGILPVSLYNIRKVFFCADFS